MGRQSQVPRQTTASKRCRNILQPPLLLNIKQSTSCSTATMAGSAPVLPPPSLPCDLTCHLTGTPVLPRLMLQLTTCGLTAQQVQCVVTSLSVPNQGPKLSYWPPAVCQFTGLSSINLSGNAITFIPQAVQNLPNLQQLLMARNDLGSLPPEIGALTALTELDVGGNKLRVLPNTLCSLTGLKVGTNCQQGRRTAPSIVLMWQRCTAPSQLQ